MAIRSHSREVVDEADVLARAEVMAGDSTRDARLVVWLLAVSHDLRRSTGESDAGRSQNEPQEENQRGTAHIFAHRSNCGTVPHERRPRKRFARFEGL